MEAYLSTETNFKKFQKTMADHVSQLQKKCDDVVSNLRDENTRLKKELQDARHKPLSNAMDEDAPRRLLDSAPNRCRLQEAATSRAPSQHTQNEKNGTAGSSLLFPCSPRDVSELFATSPRSSRGEQLIVMPATAGKERSSANLPLDAPVQPRRTHFADDVSVKSGMSDKSDEERAPVRQSCASISSSFSLDANEKASVSWGVESFTRAASSLESGDHAETKWAWFVHCLTSPSPPPERPSKKVREAKLHLQLRPFWVVLTKKSQADQSTSSTHFGMTQVTKNLAVERSKSKITRDTGLRVGSVIKGEENSCLQACTVHPDYTFGITRIVVQGAIIIFDVIDFPLLAFHRGTSQFANIMLMLSTIFWTFDMVISFLQGYHTPDGLIEMRPARIAKHYLRHWFLFDLIVLIFDYVSFVGFLLSLDDQNESRLDDATRISKMAPIMRGVRVLRLAKTVQKMRTVLDVLASSETFLVYARILLLIFTIVLINHYVACAWYGISESSSRDDTWIQVMKVHQAAVIDKYFYSLHWALTQFTPATNNIVPANGVERVFASFVVLFAMVVFSMFLSSLTAATMQIKRLSAERQAEEMQIRDFLYAKRVPLTVANRVWQYYRTHYRLRLKILQESDVPLLQVLPKSLRNELRAHVYIPVLVTLPIMRQALVATLSNMGQALLDIVSTLTPASGQDIFLEGEVATQMYFFVSGFGTYLFYGKEEMVQDPDHISEAVLWISDWVHAGVLTIADKRCEMLAISAEGFSKVAAKESSEPLLRAMRKYASLFAQHLEDIDLPEFAESRSSFDFAMSEKGGLLTDLQLDKDESEHMANEAFFFRGQSIFASGSSSFDSIAGSGSMSTPRRFMRSTMRRAQEQISLRMNTVSHLTQRVSEALSKLRWTGSDAGSVTQSKSVDSSADTSAT